MKKIRLDELVRDPVITSGFGEIRPEISPKPHKGIDLISGCGDRFTRCPERPGQGVWQYNITSTMKDAARRVHDLNGSEWPMGWYYTEDYGLIFVWLDKDTDIALILCHFEPFQSADIAKTHGVLLWEHRERHQLRYDVWHEFYGNVKAPARLQGGELVGVYSNTGKSAGDHIHLEARRVEIGTDTRAEWQILDPMDYVEVA